MGDLGPTERDVSFLWEKNFEEYDMKLSASLGATIKYDVTLNGSKILNQDAHLHSLAINSGGIMELSDSYSLTVDSTIYNYGNFCKNAGVGSLAISAPVVNSGGIMKTSSGSLALSGAISNAGVLVADSGGTLSLSGNVTNIRGLISDGGSIDAYSGSTVALNSNTVTDGVLYADSQSTFQLSKTTLNGVTFTGGGTVNVGYNVVFDSAIVNGVNVLMPYNGGSSTLFKGSLTNNGTFTITDTSCGVRWTNDLAIDGVGTFVFASNGNHFGWESTGTLTIGGGQLITTSGSDAYGTIQGKTVNNGKIIADAGRIRYYNVSAANNNLIEARNGGTVEVRDAVLQNNSVVKASDGGTIAFNASSVAGGTVELSSAGKVDLSTTTLSGVTFTGGGTVNVGYNVVFDSAIVNGVNVLMPYNGGSSTLFKGSLTNNGTFTITDTSCGVRWTNDLAIDGVGTFVFASNGNHFGWESTGTLTIGGGQLITTSGSDAYGTIQGKTVNNGKIIADAGRITITKAMTNNRLVQASNGGLLRVSADVNGIGSWQADAGTILVAAAIVDNTGDIVLKNSGRLEVAGGTMAGGNLMIDKNSSLAIGSMSSLALLGNFSFAMKDEGKWFWDSTSCLDMCGGKEAVVGDWIHWASLEVGCEDLGINYSTHAGASTGYLNNFHLETLEITEGARVYLDDLFDNGNRIDAGYGSAEALYVHTLILDDDSILNLAGIHLYYDTLTVTGTGRIINQTVPEPSSAILLAGAISGLLFFWHKRCFTGMSRPAEPRQNHP